MSRLSVPPLALFALIATALVAPPLFSQEPDLDPDDAKLAEQESLVTLESFEQFVESFDEFQDVPRVVLLLSPT